MYTIIGIIMLVTLVVAIVVIVKDFFDAVLPDLTEEEQERTVCITEFKERLKQYREAIGNENNKG